ncbi:MAG: hypothetical protein HY054_14845 [Proteobacteria bacterium]|nr:hypothetical protein [Pseudomonadota bacterium]
MSNRAILINAPVFTSDPNRLQEALDQEGREYVEIAESAYRIPIPWLCCFRKDDLRPFSAKSYSLDGTEERVALVAPCADIAAAKRNLTQSLSIFAAVAGDSEIARGYWEAAMAGLEDLPFPYLCIDPTDILFMEDLDEGLATFSGCFAGSLDALPSMKRLNFFEEGVVPYSQADLYSKLPEQLDDPARVNNAAALDAAYASPEARFWYRREE